MTAGSVWLIFGIGAGAALMAGLVLALAIRRVNPDLPFARTWLYYAVLVAFLVGVVLALGLT